MSVPMALDAAGGHSHRACCTDVSGLSWLQDQQHQCKRGHFRKV